MNVRTFARPPIMGIVLIGLLLAGLLVSTLPSTWFAQENFEQPKSGQPTNPLRLMFGECGSSDAALRDGINWLVQDKFADQNPFLDSATRFQTQMMAMIKKVKCPVLALFVDAQSKGEIVKENDFFSFLTHMLHIADRIFQLIG